MHFKTIQRSKYYVLSVLFTIIISCCLFANVTFYLLQNSLCIDCIPRKRTEHSDRCGLYTLTVYVEFACMTNQLKT